MANGDNKTIAAACPCPGNSQVTYFKWSAPPLLRLFMKKTIQEHKNNNFLIINKNNNFVLIHEGDFFQFCTSSIVKTSNRMAPSIWKYVYWCCKSILEPLQETFESNLILNTVLIYIFLNTSKENQELENEQNKFNSVTFLCHGFPYFSYK